MSSSHSCGVEFVSAREHIDISSLEGEFGAVILGGSNQLQRKQIARRVRDAVERKRERGDSIGRLLPGLIRRDERDAQGHRTARVGWDPTHAATIRELFAEYASGSHSFRSLAREMTRRGRVLPRSVDAPPREGRSTQWTPEKVRGILSNEKYRASTRFAVGAIRPSTPRSSRPRPGRRPCGSEWERTSPSG